MGRKAGRRREQQALLARIGSAADRPFLPHGLIVDGLDVVAFGSGQVRLGTGPRIGRKRIRKRSGIRLPDASLDAIFGAASAWLTALSRSRRSFGSERAEPPPTIWGA